MHTPHFIPRLYPGGGGVPRVHVHPLFKKQKQKKPYFLCRIICFYTNNPKCQYVYLSFYLNDYQIIDKVELPGGFAPLAPLPGLCPGPTGGLKRPPDPSPNNFASPISNSWLRPCIQD